jgi:hypothetical protein
LIYPELGDIMAVVVVVALTVLDTITQDLLLWVDVVAAAMVLALTFNGDRAAAAKMDKPTPVVVAVVATIQVAAHHKAVRVALESS